MKKIVAMGALIALGSFGVGSAVGQGIVEAPTPTTYLAPTTFDWSGPYIGGQLGFDAGTGNVDIIAYQDPIIPVRVSGATAGIYAGSNAQFEHLLIGVELGGNWVGATGRAHSGGGGQDYVVDRNWEASLVGRAGYVADQVLIYGLAGTSVTSLKTRFDPGAFPSATDTVWGWTLGVGTEYALSDAISVGLEYRYASYGLGKFQHGGPSTVDYDTHAVRARLSFHF